MGSVIDDSEVGRPERGPEFVVWQSDIVADRVAWEQAWSLIAASDPFSHPAYLEQVAADGEVPCCAYFLSDCGRQFLYAFIKRPIERDAQGRRAPAGTWDIRTALLYGGPLAFGDAPVPTVTVDTFWKRLREWAVAEGVVSEFVRMNPVARVRLDYPGTVREQAPHVVRKLNGLTREELVADMRKGVRRGAKKARAAGFTIRVDETGECLDDFMSVYGETMERTGAAERFKYPRGLFEAIHAAFPGRFAYIYVVRGREPVSVEMALMSDTIGYAFLGGTRAWALEKGAGVLVGLEAILYAHSRGLDDYVLTGGVTNTADDSLLRFKQRFAPNGSERYLTGEQIFDEDLYWRLACRGPAEVDPGGFFPAYRAP